MLRRFRISDDFGDTYRAEGYVILADLFDAGEVRQVLDEIRRAWDLRFQPAGGSDEGDVIVRHYNTDKIAWQQCARRMQHSLAAARLASKPAVVSTLQKAGLAEPMYSTFPELRVDMPGDARYMQPWHQDWRSGQGSLNAVTIWVALQDITAEMGAIEVLPGSHLWGLCEVEELPDPRRFSVTDSRVEGAQGPIAELAAGECALFSQMLVHRSGRNTSGRPRFTAQLRYSDRAEPRFVANGFRLPTGSEPVWDRWPDAADMRRIYGAQG